MVPRADRPARHVGDNPGRWAGISWLTEEHFAKPFDERMREHMTVAAEALMTEFGAAYGCTHSDEISVVLPPGSGLFGRGLEKLVSVSVRAAHVTADRARRRAGSAMLCAAVLSASDGHFGAPCYRVSRLRPGAGGIRDRLGTRRIVDARPGSRGRATRPGSAYNPGLGSVVPSARSAPQENPQVSGLCTVLEPYRTSGRGPDVPPRR
jgi:hypothetical protein